MQSVERGEGGVHRLALQLSLQGLQPADDDADLSADRGGGGPQEGPQAKHALDDSCVDRGGLIRSPDSASRTPHHRI